MYKVEPKAREVTNGIKYFFMPNLKGASLVRVSHYMTRIGAFFTGYNYILMDGEAIEGDDPDKVADTIFDGCNDNICIIIPDSTLSEVNKHLLNDLSLKHNLEVSEGNLNLNE